MGRRSKGLRFRKYPVTPYQKQALASLQPPEDLTVSEWAERYHVRKPRPLAERQNPLPRRHHG